MRLVLRLNACLLLCYLLSLRVIGVVGVAMCHHVFARGYGLKTWIGGLGSRMAREGHAVERVWEGGVGEQMLVRTAGNSSDRASYM